MHTFPSLKIRVDRLLLALKWCQWASCFASVNARDRESPDGFAGMAATRALIARFDIKSMIYTHPGLWSDIPVLFSANPEMMAVEIDISGLLNGLAAGFREPKDLLGGFVRFLHALAVGELTEADLKAETVA